MSIRLNKALRELNIGLQTAVEFLEKKSELGEVKSEPSFKLNDAQYKALVQAFHKDKEVKTDAEKLFQKKPKEKKRTPEQRSSSGKSILEASGHQQYKPLGKIDLNNLGKGPVMKSDAPVPPKPAKAEAAAVSPDSAPKTVAEPEIKAQPVKEKEPAQAQPAPQPKAEDKPAEQSSPVAPLPQKEESKAQGAQPAPAQKPVQKPQSADQPTPKPQPAPAPSQKQAQPEAPKTQPVQKPAPQDQPAQEPQKNEPQIFQLKSEKKILNTPKVNVLGKIDLDSLNQSTRPKKKTKEEKRKEREEKAQQHGNANNGERKKRQRIRNERVDINAAANQQNNQGGKNQGKKNKNRKRNQKPLEVNEEDVARQVKETLGREIP